MDQQTIIAEIEARASEAGLSINAVCRQARVHPTTFSRWKLSERNPDPVGANLSSIEKLYTALAFLTDKRRRRGTSSRSAAA
jgi:DNA topoisomerase IB